MSRRLRYYYRTWRRGDDGRSYYWHKGPQPERQRKNRFCVHWADGGTWRLHPGNKGQDAAPVQFLPTLLAEQVLESTEPVEWGAAELWNNTAPIPFKQEHCQYVPQIDRLGKKEVWQWCQTVGALEHGWHEIDIDADNALKWWLWLPTLMDSGHIRVGEGIEKAWIRTDGQTYAWFSFIDVRGNTINIQLSVAGGNITVGASEH